MTFRLVTYLCLACAAAFAQEYTTEQEWTFDDGTAQGWSPGGHLKTLGIENGTIVGTSKGNDPHLVSPMLDLAATPFQELWARVKCSRKGSVQLFYTNTTEGNYDGFSGKKVLSHEIDQPDTWQVIKLRPYWHAEKRIVRLRLDPLGEATTQVDWIRIVTPKNMATAVDQSQWTTCVDGTPVGWEKTGHNSWRAPLLATPVQDLRWLSLGLTAPTETHLTVYWATDSASGQKRRSTFIRSDGRPQRVELEMASESSWQGKLLLLAVEATAAGDAAISLNSVGLSQTRDAAHDTHVIHFTPENAINRVGRPATFLLRLLNDGAEAVRLESVSFTTAAQLGSLSAARAATHGVALKPYIPHAIIATVTPTACGAFPIQATIRLADDKPFTVTSRPMEVLPAYTGPADGAIPPPVPAKTTYKIGSYYYPGFGTPRQWLQLERTAPFAKPVLGYYDESNPECVDWQIKWAVEHGVSFFLVDWYWVAGQKRLMHWLEAFDKSQFRKHFKWAIMWANHNPPDTHSEEDWRDVTQFWIDHYFKTPQYLQVDGKPLVVMWSPRNIRKDMGGSDGAAHLLQMSQDMAKAAGLAGIEFYSMNRKANAALATEGYTGATTYHWWGNSLSVAKDPKYFPFSLVIDQATDAWDAHRAAADEHGMRFWPVADTGWDARPRHGDNTRVIHGRTPERFNKHLRDAKAWMDRNKEDVLVLGPWNEWTEGSYIEPCAEWGFGMLQAVHNVFCEGDAPTRVGPRDVGMGPYDFELKQPNRTRTEWDFVKDGEQCGWRSLMGLDPIRYTTNGMETKTTNHDPAFRSHELELYARDVSTVDVTLTLDPPCPGNTVVLFWATATAPINGRACVKATLTAEPTQHVQLKVADHPAWTGLIRSLRLDPCTTSGVQITIKDVRLQGPQRQK